MFTCGEKRRVRGSTDSLGHCTTETANNSGVSGKASTLITTDAMDIERGNFTPLGDAWSSSEVRIRPVDASIVGKDSWFEIAYPDAHTHSRYFSCHSSRERDEWVRSLKRSIQPDLGEQRRLDNALHLAIMELKTSVDTRLGHNMFIEVHIDNRLYARTTRVAVDEFGNCFFNEHFSLLDLPPRSRDLQLTLFKEKAGRSGNSVKKVAAITLVLANLTRNEERWHRMHSTLSNSRRLQRRVNSSSNVLRVRSHYVSLQVLPLLDYENLLAMVRSECLALCRVLEVVMNAKQKEELANTLVALLHLDGEAERLVADIVIDHLSTCDDPRLAFRANSVASKALEAYMKVVGSRYLASTLQSVVNEILFSDLDLEVDAAKVASTAVLESNQTNLLTAVKQVWSRIRQSGSNFPLELRRCFHLIRMSVDESRHEEIGDTFISSCIFLRFLCPAVLNPNLFGLTKAFPSVRANRNLTLVAKAVQSLANRTNCDKEMSLHFLNHFLEHEREAMRTFLRQISSPLALSDLHLTSETARGSFTVEEELGRQLSRLQSILSEHLPLMHNDAPLQSRLEEVLRDLVQQTRMEDCNLMEDETENNKMASKMSVWSNSLPRKASKLTFSKTSSSSCNGLRRGLSSSTLTHRRPESSAITLTASHFSLDSTTSSEDSCYSSQHTANNESNMESNSVSNVNSYQHELLELKAAMSALRLRLEAAERQLGNAANSECNDKKDFDNEKKNHGNNDKRHRGSEAVRLENGKVVVTIGETKRRTTPTHDFLHLWPSTDI